MLFCSTNKNTINIDSGISIFYYARFVVAELKAYFINDLFHTNLNDVEITNFG
jgi:hypothetical protein